MAPRRSYALDYADRAHDQLEAIRSYIAERNASAATRVIDAIERACRRSARRPYMGRIGKSSDTREWSVTRYSYVIVYHVDDRQRLVTILGVFHTAQGERKL